MAVGLLYMVSNEERMGGNDLEGNIAYYGAESGIENLTAQLSQLYQSSQSPDCRLHSCSHRCCKLSRPRLPAQISPT